MTPLVRTTIAFVAGTLAGLRTPMPSPALLLGSALAIAAAVRLVAGRPLVTRAGPAAGGAIVAALFFALGLLSAATSARALHADCRARFPDGAQLTVRGVLETVPAADGSAWLRMSAVRQRGREQRCGGSLRLSIPARGLAVPAAGTGIVVTGRWWAFPRESAWPAPPEWRGTLGVRSVRADGTLPSRPLLRARGAAQRRLRALFPERSGLAEALLLAQRGGIEAGVRQQFAASGLTHLLSISGTHVGLVAGVLLLLAGVLRLPGTMGAIGAAAGTTGYVLFLGAPHAAARAALQILLLLAGRLLQRPSDPYTLLACAALVLLAADPLALIDAGFQLSFAGIFGLLFLRRPLLDRLPARIPGWLREGIASGTAATLMTTPIAALHFGLVAWIGIAANLVAIPLVGAGVPAVSLALMMGAVHEGTATFLASGADLLLAAFVRVAAAAAAVPGGHAWVARGAVLTWLAAVAAFVAAGAFARDRIPARRGGAWPGARRPPVHRLASAAAAVAVLLAGPATLRPRGGGLEIHAIDVGQGDAFAIRSPAGHWIVVDAGPRSDDFDAGRARVVPFLLRHGVRRIDALILTHPHADHIGGALALFDAFDIGAIIDPAIAAEQELYASTLARARDSATRWLAARDGRELRFGDATIRFLAPLEDVLDDASDPNDFSVVFRLGWGRFGALFLGDAPARVENELVARHGTALSAQVLKVGHHGSRTSTGDSLLAAVQPRLALVPVGRRNRYGHPDPGVLARLDRHDIRVLRTDERGNVTVRGEPGGELTVIVTR